jgi:5,5'-dehydrodivanillate O-demethylase oxygenase subunit
MAADSNLRFVDLEPVGPGTPSGQYLRLYWQPVQRSSDLRAGMMKPIEILGEWFTLYRGADGAARLVDFRCPHRGAQLSTGWVEENAVRCRYHGWKYGEGGQCVEQPDEDRPFAHKVQLRTYPTREYLGLIFAYLGEGSAPVFPEYPDFAHPGVIVTDPAEIIPCTFWNRLDNDIAHIAWVHRATALRKNRPDFAVPRREIVEETAYGWKSTRFAKGAADGQRDTSGSAHFFMPNCYQFGVRTRAKGFEHLNLWDTKITWTVPINDTAFVAFDVTHTPMDEDQAREYEATRSNVFEDEAESRWDLAKKILAGEMTIDDIPNELTAYTSFAIEDYVTQVGQGPVHARTPERLGTTDAKVILMRKLWLREVSAMVDGRPLTEWKIADEPLQVMATATA